MFVSKRLLAAALAVVVAAFEASLRRRNATIIAICVRVQQLGAPRCCSTITSAALAGLPAERAPRGLPRRSGESYCFVKTGLGPGLISGSLYNFSAQSSALPGLRGREAEGCGLTDLEIVVWDRAPAWEPLATAQPRTGNTQPRRAACARGGSLRARVRGAAGDHGRHHGRRQPQAQVREDA